MPLTLLVGAAFGWGVERAAFRPFRKFTDEASLKSRAVREATLLSSFALGLVVREILDRIYHGEWLAIPQEYLLSSPLSIGGIHLSVGELAIGIVSVVMLASLQFMLHRTRTGIAIRAVSSNLVGAQFRESTSTASWSRCSSSARCSAPSPGWSFRSPTATCSRTWG